MRKIFRWWICFIIGAGISARGQGLATYQWTNVVAFSGLPAFSAPVCIASPPGETNRLFVCEHGGNIYVITNLAAPNKTIFMNMTTRVTLSGEAGLCGLAFHPGYATNGNFYVFYSGSTNSALCEFVSRFQVSATNTNQGDLSSETQLFAQPDRADNHNGGDVHFGPDGYLYISLGDEGSQYNFYHNAQHINSNFFSGILRIDVDKLPGSLSPNPNAVALVTTNYAIPSDNPFVGASSFNGIAVNPSQVRTEFWAVGMRNPWRFSFDPLTGIMYCGDVGQDTVEEVDIVTKGGNYGWASYEGSLNPPPGVTTNGQPIAQNAIAPIIQYNHGSATNQGNCVIGGVVYRGNRFPQLSGAYVYGEYSFPKVWGTFYDGTNASPPALLFTGSKPTAFGIDPRNGDIIYTEDGTSNLKRIISLTPTITGIDYTGTKVIIGGAGGLPGSAGILLASTNLTLPMTNWTRSVTGQIDSLGNLNLTNSVDPAASPMFYRISR